MLRGEDEDALELKIGEDFLKAKLMSDEYLNSEVAILLEHISDDQMKQMSGDSTPLPQAECWRNPCSMLSASYHDSIKALEHPSFHQFHAKLPTEPTE